jgi:hypothetical protein
VVGDSGCSSTSGLIPVSFNGGEMPASCSC